MLEKSAEKITDELLKGTYVIVADYRPDIPGKMLLQNVLHFNKEKCSMEIYTLFGNEKQNKYNLRFEHAIYFSENAKEKIFSIIKGSLPECDLFIADRNHSLNTDFVYGKSGKKYKNF